MANKNIYVVAGVALIALAIVLAGTALYKANNMEKTEGPQGLTGPQGLQGIPGETGAVGQNGIDGAIGQNGTTGTDGSQGPHGPKGLTGSHGPTGSTGAAGPPGVDCEANLPPVVTDVTPIGCTERSSDWIYSVTIDDPEDDLMKVEFYIYVDTTWFECTPLWWVPDAMGDHIWLPIYNEVGHDGIYSFNGTYIKDFINEEVVPIPWCLDLVWRYDIIDGSNFISEEVTYTAYPCCI